ncbi:MAG: Type 1 glutamine amidotransferase-like domain-containing protein [Patescibacteria group bacterium]
MKLILFGGAEVELGQVEPELKLIKEVIERLNPEQLLHIPFARTKTDELEWQGDWFNRYINLPGVEYLNADNENDIAKARHPMIFISGGRESARLITKITADHNLLGLINKASYIIGESAGAMVLGEYFRARDDKGRCAVVKGLGILKDTIIEPHYSDRKSQKLLAQEMVQAAVKYGLGIDCLTAIELEVDNFPEKYEKIGSGLIDIKNNN